MLDYDTLLELHSAHLVGSYDVALMHKDDDGKVSCEQARKAHPGALTRALKTEEREIEADGKELSKELDALAGS